MEKIFNTTGDCKPALHYMVDIENRLIEIKKLVDQGAFFTINRARQYGKTTTLRALARFLKDEYVVVSMDFQGLSAASFQSEANFVSTFIKVLLRNCNHIPSDIQADLRELLQADTKELFDLFGCLGNWCKVSENQIVLLIDEVDSASNNQIFLDFLAQLRLGYLERDIQPTFQSVILAGVHDIKNIKMKIHPDEPSKTNSPWNIATDFDIDMSFSIQGIQGMLTEYELENNVGMNIEKVAKLIHDYTSGYPFLVSRICKIMDEKLVGASAFPTKESIWTQDGVVQAVKKLQDERNTLFDSLINKLYDYEDVRNLVYMILFSGENIPYYSRNRIIETAEMYGFIKRQQGGIAIANRIFETILYDQFLSYETIGNKINSAASREKNQFIQDGCLNMELVLEKFIQHFSDIYGDEAEAFVEDVGRKYFLLFLKPIINGVGNYYIEAQTRDMRRTDVIIDYLGKQYVVEMKIWHGEEYNKRGEQQLTEYLDYYHLQTGYMLSFNFNQNKQVGMKQIEVNGKLLIEAVV